ncbi:MAG: MFS transporter, partial [Pseudomonadota bacterium]
PVFARDILQTDEFGLGMLASATPAGALMTAIFFSVRPLRTQVGPKMLGAVGVFGVATIVFGLSTSLPLSLAMLFVIGAADMFSVYVRQSLIQLHTPDGKRGRVSSVSMMTISASNEGGDAFSGGLAFLIGPVAAIVAGGAGALVTVLLWSRIFPVLRTTKSFDPPADLLEDDEQRHPQEA